MVRRFAGASAPSANGARSAACTECCRVNGVGRIAEQIKLGGLACVHTRKRDAVLALADVKRIAIAQPMCFSIHFDGPCSADIEDAQFAPLSQAGSTQLGRAGKRQGFGQRHRGANHRAVQVDIHKLNLALREEIVHQKRCAQLRRRHVRVTDQVRHLHDFHKVTCSTPRKTGAIWRAYKFSVTFFAITVSLASSRSR